MLYYYDFDFGVYVYIDRIEIQGFKSFARKTQIQFGKGISGVVGPNGCGKSNIVDAIKWCLGEQSAKSLRGQVMGDVIFNGTATEKPSDFVEVSLVFNRGDSEFKGVFQGLDEVQVTRRLHRNGQSAYLLNHSKVRLKDVQLFFMDTGLYNQRYALIEQGQIGHIIEAKPSQMRLLFEEAAGISHFNESRQSAESKLNSTQENLDKVQIVVDGLQKQLRSLERQSQKALLHKRLTSRVRQLSLAISIGQFGDLASQRGLLSEDERRIRHEEEQIERTNRRHWNMLVQAKQSLSAKQDESNQIQRQLQTAIQEYTEQQISLNFLNQRKEDLQLRITELLRVITDVEKDETSQSGILDAEKATHLGVENQLREASQHRSMAIDEHKSSTQAIRNTDNQITILKVNIDQSNRRQNQLSGEITASIQRLSDIESDLAKRAEESNRLNSELSKFKFQEESILETLRLSRTAIEESQSIIQVIKSKEQQQIDELRLEISLLTKIKAKSDELNRQLVESHTVLESTKRMVSQNDGVSGDLQRLLKQSGVLGVLTAHLIVQEKYQEVFLAALGADAELVVVDSTFDLLDTIDGFKGNLRIFQLPDNWQERTDKLHSNLDYGNYI